MTRIEETNYRNMDFSNWCRSELNDSHYGLTINDFDCILYNYKNGKLLIAEIKTRGIKNMTRPQQTIFGILDKALKFYTENTLDGENITYLGFYLISLSGTDPSNSDEIIVNSNNYTEDQLKDLLNLC